MDLGLMCLIMLLNFNIFMITEILTVIIVHNFILFQTNPIEIFEIIILIVLWGLKIELIILIGFKLWGLETMLDKVIRTTLMDGLILTNISIWALRSHRFEI